MLVTDTDLHVQLGLWHTARGSLPWMCVETPRGLELEATEPSNTAGLLFRALAGGLHPVLPEKTLRFREAHGWSMTVSPVGELAVHWPRPAPFVDAMVIDPPAGWREAADEVGHVAFFCSDDFGEKSAFFSRGDVRARLTRAASRGRLAGGAVVYHPA